MQRREFCDLLSELLERSGYSLTTEETQFPTYGDMYSQVCYHTPEDMLEEVGCIPIHDLKEEHDPVYMYLNYVIPKEVVIPL